MAMLLLIGCPSPPQFADCVTRGECECRGPGDCPDGKSCVNGHCAHLPDASQVFLAFGERCLHDDQCESQRCIPAGSGMWNLCTRPCATDEPCPSTWDCKLRPGEPDEWLCAEHLDRLCQGCTVDEHCHPAFGDRCLTLDDGTRACGLDCSVEPCPRGTRCQVLAGGPAQCVPESGACACDEQNLGLVVGCSRDNIFGSCRGTRSCEAGGMFTDCSAAEAMAELCNGIDDDCDALVDADDDSVDIGSLPLDPPYPFCQRGNAPSCRGRWSCQLDVGEQYGWVCDAVQPVDEICDGLDNDCDGSSDEDYLDTQGRYLHPSHCGGCGRDCSALIEGLAHDASGQVAPDAARCELVDGEPTCIPQHCAPGFAPYPEIAPITCLALVSPQCRPCTDAGDCVLSWDRCLPVGLDPHLSCLQGCGAGSPYGTCDGQTGTRGCCPPGHLCQDVEGMALCVPAADSCDCDIDSIGLSRACFVPGSGDTVCVGAQLCQADAALGATWTVCDASATSVEVCDGVDNDCNGTIDDPFIDTRGSGTYDTDEHCGACNINCPSLWNPEIQHAVGGCRLAPRTSAPRCEIVACTDDSAPGQGLCRADSDCAPGYTCDPRFFVCTRACQVDGDCVGGRCVDNLCGPSCATAADCSAFGPVSSCVSSVCQVRLRYNNVDDVDSNGCECAAPRVAQIDSPEIFETYPDPGVAYVDRDCDGVDGRASAALFVWSGSGDSRGTRIAPYRTVGEAMAAYDPTRHSQILVAAGEYNERVDLRVGLRLYGGYSPDFAHRDVVLYPSILSAPEPSGTMAPGVVNAVGIQSGETVLAGFVIYGYDVNGRAAAGARGASSYAVYLSNSSAAVTLANNVILAGRGGNGGNGGPGSPGVAGARGGDGRNSVECHTPRCRNESQQGGNAGANNGCTDAAGRGGAPASGDADPQQYSSTSNGDGLGGGNGAYSSQFNPEWRDLCKYDCTVAEDMNGDDAQSGTGGTAGGGGAGCIQLQGAVVGGRWQAANPTTGTRGNNGRGGGGGGAGGCVINENPASCTVGNRVGDLGATGGGGGAGGCGGSGGQAAGAGGGSFAIFIGNTATLASFPVIQGNVIYRGEGGAGGHGGDGGHGGLGGVGGSGGVPVNPAWCAGFGGKGGRGGDGGSGGGGGGACGGVSYGVAGNISAIASYRAGNSFVADAAPSSGGPPGHGGTSPAGPAQAGSDGSAGAWGDVHAY
ncbi:MAG: MopE-related protein [Pseudomonadota bacterium]